MRLSTPLKTVAITSRRSSPFDAGKRAQIGEQARPALPVGRACLVLVDEGEQLVAGDAVVVGGPVAPAVGRLDRRPELLARELGLVLALLFHVVQELEEHDPGEHRQTVEVAVQALVLAHDVARGLDQAPERLRRGRAAPVAWRLRQLRARS